MSDALQPPSAGQPQARFSARALFALVWRLALYLALLFGALRGLSRGMSLALHSLGVHFSHPPGVQPAEQVLLSQIAVLLAAVLATSVLTWIDRRQAIPALPLRRAGAAQFLQGSLWGLAATAVLIGGIALVGGYRIAGLATSGPALAYYAALWAVTAVVNGIAENLALLGYPLLRTARLTGFAPAIGLVGALFAAAHLGNGGENPLGLASVFLIGAVMAAAVWLTGDLWLSAGLHAGAVFAEDFLFSVPDSGETYTGHLLDSRFAGPAWLTGGSAGPEGSLLAFPVFAVVLMLLWAVYRRRPTPSA